MKGKGEMAINGDHGNSGRHSGPNNAAGGVGYSAEALVRVRKKRKKHRTLKRVLIGVVIAVVVLAGGVAAYGAWYMNSLSNNMSMSEQDQQQLQEVLSPAPQESKAFYMLLVGSDNWESYGERSDALVLIRIDPASHQVTMVSVPRDTPYMLNGQKVKINQAFAEKGAMGAVEAVQQLTGVDISYYAEIEFAGLSEFVDSIGGIYVDVPYTIDYQVYTKDQDVVHIDAGQQRLDGEQCVALARMRTAYTDLTPSEDAMRQSNVRAMTLSLMKAVLQSSPAAIPGLVQDLSKCISTSMDLNTMVSLATDFAQAGNVEVYTCTGPWEGAIDSETGLWLCYEDPEGWADLMQVVDQGGNPETASTTVNEK